MDLNDYPVPYLVIEYDGDFPPQDYEEHIVSGRFVDPNNLDRSFYFENAIMQKRIIDNMEDS